MGRDQMTSPPYHGAVVVSWCGLDVTCVDTAHSDVALLAAVQGAGVVGARTKMLTSLKNAHLDSSNHFEPVAVDTSTFYFCTR